MIFLNINLLLFDMYFVCKIFSIYLFFFCCLSCITFYEILIYILCGVNLPYIQCMTINRRFFWYFYFIHYLLIHKIQSVFSKSKRKQTFIDQQKMYIKGKQFIFSTYRFVNKCNRKVKSKTGDCVYVKNIVSGFYH